VIIIIITTTTTIIIIIIIIIIIMLLHYASRKKSRPQSTGDICISGSLWLWLRFCTLSVSAEESSNSLFKIQ
jgi:preprotein translocase subunit SecG